ncbi:hypothetical protein Ahy_B09g096214 isoform F [Arachis hypogaea]|uniref:Uncharacterized protein n=1 Tax=Arachis hypogaea TaxID=3818 RepID=A0A444XJ64_ARAHY|nr:hypothetical protein Ahy_B09g096214 isoform F [Arachis hypogaea]
MPLYELYRLSREKLDEEINGTRATDFESRPEKDFFELIWENGNILTTQGQSSRAKKSPPRRSLPSHCLPSHSPKGRDRDAGYVNNSRVGKSGDLDTGLNEISMSVPSTEVDLGHDDDVIPWLDYTMDGSLQNEYGSNFLHELSGVTDQDLPSNHFSLVDKSSGNQVFRDSHKNSAEQSNFSSVSSTGVDETTRPKASTVESYLPSSFISVRPRVSGVTANDTSNAMLHPPVTEIPSSSSDFSSLKMQKQDQVIPSNGSSVMNFSHFARPAAIVRANLQNIGLKSVSSSTRSENVESMNKGAVVPSSNLPESTLADSCSECPKVLMGNNEKAVEQSRDDLKLLESKSLEQNIAGSKQLDPTCKEKAIKIDQTSNRALGETATNTQIAVERSTELVVASSSVGSGNCADRGSDDPIQNLKRKNRDTEDSEWHSDDVEEESVGVKKAAAGRGASGSKRSRAAEVHNLSERMMSMGAGLYMHPMMLPHGMQHMHAPHLAPFSPMAYGMQMGLGMGYGMAMPDMNGVSSRFPMVQVPQMQGTHVPVAQMSGATAMVRSNTQGFGVPGQGFPLPLPRAPLFPFSGGPVMNSSSALGLRPCGATGLSQTADLASTSGLKDPSPNTDSLVKQSTGGGGCDSTSQMPTQVCLLARYNFM